MAGYVGTQPGTLTVRVPYGDSPALMGARGLGMIDPSRFFNYGRDDGRSPLPMQPMFEITKAGGVQTLSGPTPQLLGQVPQLLGKTDITLLGGGVMIPRVTSPAPQLLGDAFSEDAKWSKRTIKIVIAAGVLSMLGGIVGAAIGAGEGHRGDAAAGAAIGSLLSPFGTAVGAAIGAGEGRRLRAGGASVAGIFAGGVVGGGLAYLLTDPVPEPSGGPQ